MSSKTRLSHGVPMAVMEQIFGVSRSRSMELVKALTNREREVVDLMAKGIPNSQLAGRLNISPKTLDIHRQNICKKLGVHPIGVPRIVLACQLLDLVGAPLERVAVHGA